jgi:hypothetical protein
MVNKSGTVAPKPPDMNLRNYNVHGALRCGVHVNNLHLFFSRSEKQHSKRNCKNFMTSTVVKHFKKMQGLLK